MSGPEGFRGPIDELEELSTRFDQGEEGLAELEGSSTLGDLTWNEGVLGRPNDFDPVMEDALHKLALLQDELDMRARERGEIE